MEFGHFSVRYQPLVCPGECLVRCYKETRRHRRCHGLVPWSFTLAATKRLAAAEDATALCRGVLRLLLQRGSPPQKMPRPCAVESSRSLLLQRDSLPQKMPVASSEAETYCFEGVPISRRFSSRVASTYSTKFLFPRSLTHRKCGTASSF